MRRFKIEKTAVLVILCIIVMFGHAAGTTYKRINVNQHSVTFKNADGYWGFYDIRSGYKSEEVYEDIDDNCYDPDAPIFVKKNGLWGYVSRSTGETVIPFQYTSDYGEPCFKHGYALVSNQITDEEGDIRYLSSLIDMKGNAFEVDEGYDIMTGVRGSKKNLVIAGKTADGRYKYGIYRIGEGIIVQPKYENIVAGDCDFFCFYDENDHVGLLDSEGTILIEPIYTSGSAPIVFMSSRSQYGLTPLQYTGYYVLYREDGEKILIIVDDETHSYCVFDPNEE